MFTQEKGYLNKVARGVNALLSKKAEGSQKKTFIYILFPLKAVESIDMKVMSCFTIAGKIAILIIVFKLKKIKPSYISTLMRLVHGNKVFNAFVSLTEIIA